MSNRILIYRCGSLGDTIVALPALKLIARAYPNAERWLLTNFGTGSKLAPMASILEGMGLVHGYIEYPAGLREPRRAWRLRQGIRAVGAHTVIYLTEPEGYRHTLRNAAFLWSCGLRHQIGVPWRPDLQRVRQIAPGQWEPEAVRQARCIAKLGDPCTDDLRSYDLLLNTAELSEAEQVLEPLRGRRLIALSVGTKLETKDWEDERWAPLIKQLSYRYPDHGLVMTGSLDETARCEALGAPWRGRALNLCGLSVRATAAVFRRCAVFLGHDSGPMHLAAAAGTRCVAIFSSIHLPGKWFPCGEGHRVLYQPVQCQGCQLGSCRKYEKKCIRSISIQSVLAAVSDILDSQSSAHDISAQRMTLGST